MSLGKLTINPIIFRRFFFRKRSNNSQDFLLTLTFILIIALSSALIVRTSFEIIKFQEKIDEFNSNEWNKVFQLFLKDCFILSSEDEQYVDDTRVPLKVKLYLDSLAVHKDIQYNPIYDMYPAPIKIKSENGSIPKIQAFLLGSDYSYIVDHIAANIEDAEFMSKHYIYVEESLIPYLGVQDGDVVLVKDAFSQGSKYSIPLRVKVLKQSSRIKCFMFEDYLMYQGDNLNKKIMFTFDTLDEAIEFAFKQLFMDWTTLDPPYYLNAEGTTFMAIANSGDQIRDFVMPAKSIPKLENTNRIDFRFTDSKGVSELYSVNFDNRELSVLYLDEFKKALGGKLNDISKVEILSDLPSLEEVSVQIDFSRNFSLVGDVQKKQEELFKYIPYAKNLIIDYSPNKRKQIFDNVFFYYNNFSDIEMTSSIMQRFDAFNIRWDSGRWKTVIDFNNSLQAGKKNIKLLLVVNIFVIIFFLIIKFYLRLKLEFHSIGTLRCFGYSINEMSRIYTLGYSILIAIGFILGIFPTSYIMGILSGLTHGDMLKVYHFLIHHPLNYTSSLFVVLIILTAVVINIILRNFIKRDNIYELIKFES
ncbi:MAG: ABC transporter permease [Candidatus Cloacimonetes bacterium]|nr:ABC transporter permease [Candidatus Cloacimonadota bacterium]